MNLEATATPPAASTRQRKCILVVEDERQVRRMVSELLTGAGYEVIGAADGSEALSHAQHDEPDLMLLDLALPSDPFGGGNFDGFGVMQWLKHQIPDRVLPVIILTGRQDATARRRAAELGAAAYFTKPFDSAELLAAIRNVLGDG
jgi:DNA-binding response OmpR family regulator